VKTLAVCYSKTGTTKTVAEAIAKKLNCDLDELSFDEKIKKVSGSRNPADYDRVIILSPVWAFSLAEPMKLYLEKHKSGIKSYSLVVTCGMFGLRGCVKKCRSIIGKPPEKSLIFKQKAVRQGNYDISSVS
jgi:flavodoxin